MQTLRWKKTVFFFPVKIKSARESHFWGVFRFFSRAENRFHAYFFHFFHGHSSNFTGTFLKIFTGWKFSVSGAKILILLICPWKFSEIRIFRKFSRANFVFHGHFFCFFHGHFYFSRALSWKFSRVGFFFMVKKNIIGWQKF